MLQKCRKALRIATDAFDSEINDLIKAAIDDIRFNTGAQFEVITDQNGVHISEPLVQRAVITYVRCNFGAPDEYDKLKASYDEQKAQLRCNGHFREGCGC